MNLVGRILIVLLLGSTSTVSDEGCSVHQLGEFSRQDTSSSIIR